MNKTFCCLPFLIIIVAVASVVKCLAHLTMNLQSQIQSLAFLSGNCHRMYHAGNRVMYVLCCFLFLFLFTGIAIIKGQTLSIGHQ